MANKDPKPIENFDEPFEGHSGSEVEAFLKEKLKAHEEALSDRETLDVSFNPAESGLTGTLSIRDGKAKLIGSCEIPMGGGAGSAEGIAVTRITAEVDHPTLTTGSDCVLSYSYDNIYSGGPNSGAPTGRLARIEVEIIGASMASLYKNTTQNVAGGSYTLSIGKYLQDGDNSVYVRAYVTDDEGVEKMRQAYVKVSALSLQLDNLFTYDEMMAGGGFAEDRNINIPFSVSGPGNKTVQLYVDGLQQQAKGITKDGVSRGSFQIADLLPGIHNVQLVAVAEKDGVTVRSASYFIDVYVSDSRIALTEYICVMCSRPDGAIVPRATSGFIPKVEVQARGTIELIVAAAGGNQLRVLDGEELLQTVALSGHPISIRQRFTDQGEHTVRLSLGEAVREVAVTVTPPAFEIAETTEGLVYKLEGAGGVESALVLASGSTATIDDCKPFATDISTSGMTLEMTLRVTNPLDRALPVIECAETLADGGIKGLRITGEDVAFYTGAKVRYTNEDGASVSRDVKISSTFSVGEWIKVALVIRPKTEGVGDRLMELFINGDRVAADIYGQTFDFRQAVPSGLVCSSAHSDVEIRSVRMYERDLSDDELLENHIADIRDSSEMEATYTKNDILNSAGTEVDIARLMSRGMGVLRIVRKGKLAEVFATNDKKADFLADVIFTSPYGEAHSFVLRRCYIRIQGTSSTKYPAKNLRIYFTKGSDVEMTVEGQTVRAWPIRPGNAPVSLICLKKDYSDSSMSQNTGGARLFNDVFKELGLLTPPQQWQQAHGQDITARTAIDGYPIDVFVSEAEDGAAEYVGQYNLNNEKSKSGKVFGMEGIAGYTPECPLALEMLNNSSPVCLYDTEDDDHLEREFDKGAEINYPDDVKWAGMTEAQRAAVKRFWGFLRDCKPAGADASQLGSYASAKFREEASQYMDVDFMIAYYLFMNYGANVDQFAKNILLRTWDGLKWYATYYDGDTAKGFRNDCWLVYPYTMMRDFRDAEMNKYAMEGHDSLLWNLLLANFPAEFRAMARTLREVMTTERMLQVFNEEQCGHWSTRAYNKSGELSYILPATVGTVDKNGAVQKWPYIFALHGSNIPHRTFFIRNRNALLDAFYGVSTAHDDNIDLYLARTGMQVADRFLITASEDYVFGFGTNNSPDIFTSSLVSAGESTEIAISGTYTINDPLRIYGASRIRTLDMRAACSHIKNQINLNRCTALQELDLSVTGSSLPSEAWSLGISGCRSLSVLNLYGQTHVRTSDSSAILDLTAQSRLEELDARGTSIEGVLTAPGAPIKTLRLPATTRTLILDGHADLTLDGLQLAEGAKLETISVKGCPKLDVRPLVEAAIAAGSLRSLTLEGIEWTGVNLGLVNTLATMESADISGHIELRLDATNRPTFQDKLSWIGRWGNVDTESSRLRISYLSSPLNEAELVGDLFLYKTGIASYRLRSPQTYGNDIAAVAWTMTSSSFARRGNVKPGGFELDVLELGSVELKPTVTIACELTKTDGTSVRCELTVGVYPRPAQLGDYVFCDGSYGPTLCGKTPVGVCFYINPENPEERMMVALKDHSRQVCWGIYNANFPDLSLDDNPEYDVYNVALLNDSGPGDRTWQFDAFADDSSVNGLKQYPAGEHLFIGFSPLGSELAGYRAGDRLPVGMANTLKIVKHRDTILSDSALSANLPIPAESPGESLFECLQRLCDEAKTNNGNDEAYMQFYYPAASLCHAWEPAVGSGETLHERFRCRHWFLPSAGEAAWLAYFRHQGYNGENEHAIFSKAYNAGVFQDLNSYMKWTSTELYARSGQGIMFGVMSRVEGHPYTKNTTYNIRPCCAF